MSIQSEIDAICAEDLMENVSSSFGKAAQPFEIEPDKSSRLVFLTDPNGLAVEQYKLLRRRLCILSPTGGMLLVTSPSPGDGKTLSSINLAWCLADGGHKTCLVDLDFRAPSVGYTLGFASRTDGVVEILAGDRTISQVIRQVGSRPLHVLGIKESIPSPSHELAAATLKPFLKELREKFEWVILDMAPTIPISDVSEVLPHVDGALIVVRTGKTSKSLITPTVKILGGKLWGAILNDSIINGSAYYGNYGYTAKRNRKK